MNACPQSCTYFTAGQTKSAKGSSNRTFQVWLGQGALGSPARLPPPPHFLSVRLLQGGTPAEVCGLGTGGSFRAAGEQVGGEGRPQVPRAWLATEASQFHRGLLGGTGVRSERECGGPGSPPVCLQPPGSDGFWGSEVLPRKAPRLPKAVRTAAWCSLPPPAVRVGGQPPRASSSSLIPGEGRELEPQW